MSRLSVLGYSVRLNENDLVSLTDLWKANGGNYNQRPAHWFEQDNAQEFIQAVASKLNVRQTDLYETRRGRGVGGTYAHWQIALAYAKYLSPELHIAVNEVFKQYVEANPALALSVLERTTDQTAVEQIALKSIDKTENPEALKRQANRATAKLTNKALNAEIDACGGTQKTYAVTADKNNVAVTGMRAKQIKEYFGVAQTREAFNADDLAHMAFLESLERSSLVKKRPQGHAAIISEISACVEDVAKLVSAYR